MVEQWNSDSKGWWNNGTVIVKGGGTVIVKGGGSVEQCHNLMIVRVVTRKQARCLSWILESLIDEKKHNRRIACDRCTTLSGYRGKQTVE